MAQNQTPVKILVVDDNERARKILLRILKEEGFEPAGASDAHEALAQLSQGGFAIVILDLLLPGTSGMELLNTINAEHPQVKVIVLTGLDDKNVSNIIMGKGAFAYLIKPCKMDVLLGVIRQAMGEAAVSVPNGTVGSSQEGLSTARSVQGRRKVLVVDDEEHIRKNVCRVLTLEGYEAVGAASGKEALEKLAREEFPVALIDIKMPGMDGLELLRRISEKSPRTVRIMLTGMADKESVQAALAGRAFGYLIKPCKLDDLIGTVRRAFEYSASWNTMGSPYYSKGKCVLVVDDERNVRENLVRFLNEEGYDAEGAFDGADALFKLSQQKFAVVILDIKMPGMNGSEVLREIKRNYPQTCVIVLSTLSAAQKSEAEIRSRLIQDGAYTCLEKPCKLDDLLRTIEDGFRHEKEYWEDFLPVTRGRGEVSEEEVWKSVSEP